MNQTLRELPIEQRLNLVEELWNSIEEDQQEVPVSREHIDILDQRLAAFEQDQNLGVPAEDVLMEMKKQL